MNIGLSEKKKKKKKKCHFAREKKADASYDVKR